MTKNQFWRGSIFFRFFHSDRPKDLLRWDQSLADQCTLHQIRSNHRLSHFNHFHQSYHFQFAIPSKVVLNECHGHFVRSFGTPAQRKRGFYIAIVPLSLTTHQPQNAIFTFVGRFWSESQSISFVVFRWVCLVSELSAPTPQCLSAAKRWLCAAAGMRCGNARAADRGWTSQLRHRPPSELKLPDVCWPAELKLVELAQRLAAAPLALNQHICLVIMKINTLNKSTDFEQCLDLKIISWLQLLWELPWSSSSSKTKLAINKQRKATNNFNQLNLFLFWISICMST